MMTEKNYEKYKRLQERNNELNVLNGNIARLAFYINENEIDRDIISQLDAQLEAMVKYRNILEERIECGNY